MFAETQSAEYWNSMVTTGPKYGEEVPKILDLPVGIGATGTRTESDSMGNVEDQLKTTGGLKRNVIES